MEVKEVLENLDNVLMIYTISTLKMKDGKKLKQKIQFMREQDIVLLYMGINIKI